MDGVLSLDLPRYFGKRRCSLSFTHCPLQLEPGPEYNSVNLIAYLGLVVIPTVTLTVTEFKEKKSVFAKVLGRDSERFYR